MRENPDELERMIMETASRKDQTISALVRNLSRDFDCEPDEVIEHLMRLRSEDKITFTEQGLTDSLSAYVLSATSLWFWGTVASLLLSLGLLYVAGLALFLRYFFDGILVLFLPGYSLVELLYPEGGLGELMKGVLSIGLSIALVSIDGLILNYTPFGIRLFSIAFSLACLTVVLLLLALGRKYRRRKARVG